VLRVVLQGDVVQQAEVEVLDAEQAGSPSFWPGADGPGADGPGADGPGADGRLLAARELDALGRLLSVAGWPDAAARSRRLRDDLLAGAPAGRLITPAATLARRVRRSRTLRWLLRGVDAGGHEVTAWLDRRFDIVGAALARLADPSVPRPEPAPSVDPARLPDLLAGLELAAARNCGGANACFVASFEGRRHGVLPHRTNLDLAGGDPAYYHPISCGASCAPASLWFVHKSILYSWQVKDPPRNAKAVLARLANEAIEAGPR